MRLNFVYVSRSDFYRERMKQDWQYISEMTHFYRWWLRKKFKLFYSVTLDALVIEKVPLMRFRFGMSDLMKHHKEKGEDVYHFYLSYFKPIITDCSAGFFTDNVGLVEWRELRDSDERNKFLAIENCTRISHVMLHEIGRQKNYDGKKFKEQIHEQWDKHVYGMESFEFYDKRFHEVPQDDEYMFATMKVPPHNP